MRTKSIIYQLSLTAVCLLVLFSLYLKIKRNNTEAHIIRLEKMYPGGYLENSKPSSQSYCKFNYGMPTALNYEEKNIMWGPEMGKRGLYRILYNVTEAQLSKDIPGVTYATHITAEFVNYVPELVRLWEGPISISAFVPDLDVAYVLEQISQFCYCIPGMSRVSLHIIYPKKMPPSRKDVYFTSPSTCMVINSSEIKTVRYFDENVIYPINVCRNAAREGAITAYVLVSDVQLMPSEALASRFLRMLNNLSTKNVTENQNVVYVLPTFEIEAGEKLPKTKEELFKLINENKAVFFHEMVCRHCQRFPGIEEWMKSNPGNDVKPYINVKREYPYHRWEPIFIGTKNDPLYNEALSWEGVQDKMAQMLEMCLKSYDFVILDGAFLVHWPGIKRTRIHEENWRTGYFKDNEEQYLVILKKLIKKYDINLNCKVESGIQL